MDLKQLLIFKRCWKLMGREYNFGLERNRLIK